MTRRRVDANQGRIVAALERIGATVVDLHTVGGGCPDLLAGYRGINYALEVKDGAKPPSRRKVRPGVQATFHQTWRGQIDVVCTELEAIAVVTGNRARPQAGFGVVVLP